VADAATDPEGVDCLCARCDVSLRPDPESPTEAFAEEASFFEARPSCEPSPWEVFPEEPSPSEECSSREPLPWEVFSWEPPPSEECSSREPLPWEVFSWEPPPSEERPSREPSPWEVFSEEPLLCEERPSFEPSLWEGCWSWEPSGRDVVGEPGRSNVRPSAYPAASGTAHRLMSTTLTAVLALLDRKVDMVSHHVL
jgi:hypothetical protein